MIKLFELIQNNNGIAYELISAILVIAIAIFLYVKGYNKTFLNKLTLKFVVEAEIKLGSGTGKYKYNEVFTNIYKNLPFIVKLFISENKIKDLIELNVRELGKFLNSGGDLSGYTIKTKTEDTKK